jgi:Putative zinc- or iron-chelating domain
MDPADLSMTEEFDLNGFADCVQETALAVLSDGRSEHFGEAARAVQEMAEVALARHGKRLEQIACRAGCGHCCVVNVAVLEPEVAAILQDLRRRLSGRERSRLRQRARALYRMVVGLDDEERIMLRQPCLFLTEQGECSIHPVRPLLCRGMTSTDPERCRNAITLAPLGEAPTVIINLFQKSLFDHAFKGLARAMEKAGLDPRSRKLSVAIHRALHEA